MPMSELLGLPINRDVVEAEAVVEVEATIVIPTTSTTSTTQQLNNQPTTTTTSCHQNTTAWHFRISHSRSISPHHLRHHCSRIKYPIRNNSSMDLPREHSWNWITLTRQTIKCISEGSWGKGSMDSIQAVSKRNNNPFWAIYKHVQNLIQLTRLFASSLWAVYNRMNSSHRVDWWITT